MTSVVTCCVDDSDVSCCITSASVLESSDAVPSSTRSTDGLRRNALAMATRCFSPPDNFKPRSPTTVSRPSGREATTSSNDAAVIAAATSSFVAP
mmetsp:Transcript_46386/g.123230  ORF Transcript_46386/g.123230 Transcript_46386/m.123230 type:complete len:95 (+) Transcript_46386:314-598(+)